MSSRSRGNIPRRGTLVLASTSPQRRAILDQLRIPYEAVAPRYEEHDPPEADPVELVCAHAVGKARSVHRAGSVTLGVDTTVHLGERIYAKPNDAHDAAAMLAELAGRTHAVLSGLCVLSDRGDVVQAQDSRTNPAIGRRIRIDNMWIAKAIEESESPLHVA